MTCGADPGDYYPEDLWEIEIDQNQTSSSTNGDNGVLYRCGILPHSRRPYDEAIHPFATLDLLEQTALRSALLWAAASPKAELAPVHHLGGALIRSIVGHFKCNLRRIVDYPKSLGATGQS